MSDSSNTGWVVIGLISLIAIGTGLLFSNLKNLSTVKAVIGGVVLLGFASIAAAVALLQ